MPKSSTSKVSRKKNKEEILDLKTVNECNKCLGAETLHPQASVINLDGADLRQAGVKFEFYAVLLIDECADGCCCCGRRYYDFATATMVFLTPGEVFRLDAAGALPPKGLLLAYHPDLLFRTALNRHINDYTFFFYRKEEALHLSQRERRTVVKYFDDINEELHHPIDAHSRTLVLRLIELLLDYCTRYYERQLITRENKNRDLMGKLGRLVDHGIEAGLLSDGHGLTVDYCADRLGLSPAYFKDLLKFETGKSFAEYLLHKRLAAAKRMLLTPSASPAAVARRLGFASTQQFSFIFKKLTGVAPADYRFSSN